MNPLMHFVRIRELQYRCWQHGHKKWARALGIELQAFRADNPGIWQDYLR
jgi:hypothetical protein